MECMELYPHLLNFSVDKFFLFLVLKAIYIPLVFLLNFPDENHLIFIAEENYCWSGTPRIDRNNSSRRVCQ